MSEEAETAAPEEAPETTEITPTSAADWPTKAPGIVVQLPSGGVARLRRPPIQLYIATGRVPSRLWKKVQKEGGEVFADPLNSFTSDELAIFVDWMVAASFVEPKVSMTRKDGEKYIGDLDELDKERVMELLGLSLAG